MLVHGNDTVEWLEPPGGPALGLASGEWPIAEVEWPEGTACVLLTDGLFEGHSGQGNERLGEDGLLEVARSLAALPGPQFVDALIEERGEARRIARRTDRRHRGGPGGADPPDDAIPRPTSPLTVQGWQNLVLSSWACWCSSARSPAGLLMQRTDERVARADRQHSAGPRRRPTRCRPRCAIRRPRSAGT